MNYIKIALIITGIIFLVWFVVPLALFGIINAGNVAGMSLSSLIILYGISFYKTNQLIVKCWEFAAGKIILVIFGIVALSVIIFVIAATVKMIRIANNEPNAETTVVVLGCQVKPYGPSLMLRERLDAAYQYLSENENVNCVLSGGQGSDEPMSEAQCMYDWLVKKGIDKERLYIEDKSTSTRENLIFSKQIIEKNGLNPTITIITNEFHQYRASEIAKSLGIENYNVSAKTLITLLPTYYVRELGGILFEIFISVY